MLSVKPALIAEVETMRGHVWNQCVVLFHRIDLRYHGLTYVPIAFDSKQWIQNFEPTRTTYFETETNETFLKIRKTTAIVYSLSFFAIYLSFPPF